MTLEQWVVLAASGALFGIIGQAIRTAMGLRKLSRASGSNAAAFSNEFSAIRVSVGLLLGAMAGVVSAMAMPELDAYKAGGEISATFIMSIVAAGYAGGDFLEGVVKSQFSTKT